MCIDGDEQENVFGALLSFSGEDHPNRASDHFVHRGTMNKRAFPSPAAFHWGALQIAGIYLLFGSLWILFSDQVAARVATNEEMFTTISLYKGWGYVLVTALLFYWMIRRHISALQATENQLRRVMDAMPAFIGYVGSDLHYRFTNQAYREMFDHAPEGKHMEEVLGKPAFKIVSKYIDNVLKGQTTSFETELPHRERELFVTATYIPDIGADGKAKGFFVMAQDRTRQKQAEEEQRLWADAFEGCAQGIAIADPNTNRIVVCNPAFATLHKSRVEEIVGSAILSLFEPSDHEHVRRSVQKADQIGHARFEARMTRRGKEGSTFPVEVDVVSVLGDDGELLHRVATAQDISERKLMDEKLKESETKYRTLVEHLPVITYISEPDPYVGVTYISPQIESLGFDIQAWLADPELWLRHIHPEDLEEVKRELQQFQDGANIFRAEYRIILPGGETRWFQDESNRVKDENGRTILKQGFMLDITDRKQAEMVLQESEERYRIVSELASDYAYKDCVDEDGSIVPEWVTESFTRITGYTLEEAGAPGFWQQLVHPQDLSILQEHIHAALSGEPHVMELRVITKDGSLRWLRDYSNPIWDVDQNRVVTLFGAVKDITERKQAETALSESITQFRTLFEASPDAILLIDPHDHWPILDCNTAAGEMNGYTRDELIGQPVDILNPNPYDPVERDEYLEKIRREGILRYETPHRRKDGTEFPIEVSTTMISLNGRDVLLGIDRDITERKQIEKALQEAHDDLENKVQERTAALSEANALLQALMDNIPDHIYFKDMQSRFIRNSRSQATLLGLRDPSEAVGKTDFDFFPHAASSYADEQEVMRTGKPHVDFEEWVVWPDGQEMWVSTTKMPLRKSDGQTIGIFGISRDITERKRNEQAIQQLNADLEKQAERLQAANKELEAFSYSVSHDLRAPLRAIDGYTRILMEDYEPLLDSEGKRVCNVISREARRMGQLIDDLLAFSRLGRKEMYASRIDMRGLAVSVLNELIKDENQERMEFHIGKLPAVKGDSSLIRQVWVNLLSNAIKFTSRKARAVIEVGSKTSKDEFIYYVRDNGAGFEMEYANKLFGVFQRLHSESEFSGTGVGLAIVQRIIRRHGGRVWAEGEVGKGATFYFALPRKEISDER